MRLLRRNPIPLCALTIAVGAALLLSAPFSAARRPLPGARMAKGPEPIVGVISGASNWGERTMATRLDHVVSRTRAKWLREGFYWSRIEPRRGVFDFSHYDHFMLLAARHHEHVVAILYTAPSWAAPAWNAIPSDPSAYAGYVAAVVGRYGPGGSFWAAHPGYGGYAIDTYDIWQEPYYDVGNHRHYDPARYARLVKAAAQAGKAVNPAAKFLLAAEMQGAYSGSRFVWWVDALYEAVPDLNSYFDGVAVHPYGHDIRHRSPAIPGRAYYGYDQMRRIEIIHQQFASHGAADKPFWVTEVGWPTCTHGSSRCVTTGGQKRSLRALIHYARTIWGGWVKAVFIYFYDDQHGPRSNPENDYGLLYADHRPKPALSTFRGFAARAPDSPW